MAYGFLKRLSKKDSNLKDYLQEGMVFEAFIYLIREGEIPPQKLFNEIEKEAYLKNPRLSEVEYSSLHYEWCDYTTYDYQNHEVIWRE